jgi:hypothetical protein
MRKTVCGVVGLFLFSMTAFGHWTRPSLPAPAEDAIVATVGSVGCNFTSIRDTAVSDEAGPHVDQRGLPRPFGSAPDLGAVEVGEADGDG